jgi:CRISPR system Cascade subunit CasC
MEENMVETRFLQVHTLTSYPGALLNRDDAGLAKRLPFGGTTRARISSQCQKRRWRTAKGDPWALSLVGVPMGSRTKEIVERVILPKARAKVRVEDDVARAVEEVFIKHLYGERAGDTRNRQALFFGQPEVDYLSDWAAEALAKGDAKEAAEVAERFFKDGRENLRALKNGAGLEAALFGRMVTSDPAANTDAAIHVAHAITVHEIERELDFMTAVDDLKGPESGDDAGAAGMFDMELASGLYYGYVVVDVPLLIKNLAGDREIAARVVKHLLHLITQVSPGAKKGSTAPYAWAEFVLVEAGMRQPRTLANAFRQPIDLRRKGNRLFDEAVECIAAHLEKLDGAYGTHEARRVLNLSAVAIAGVEPLGLDRLADWAGDAILADTDQ